jgi:hypothetical protein
MFLSDVQPIPIPQESEEFLETQKKQQEEVARLCGVYGEWLLSGGSPEGGVAEIMRERITEEKAKVQCHCRCVGCPYCDS